MSVVLFLTLAPPLLTVAAFRAGEALRRARARRRHGRVLAAMGPADLTGETLAATSPRTTVTVEGVLTVPDGEAIASFHPYGPSMLDVANVYAVTAAPAGLEIRLDGGARVLLEGAVQVVSGATESEHDATRGALKKTAPALHGEATRQGTVGDEGQIRILSPGARVRARGVVLPAPDDEALYRDRSAVMRMTPEAPKSPAVPNAIPLASRTAPSELRTRGRSAEWVAVAAAALAGLSITAAVRSAPAAPSAITVTQVPAPTPPCRAEVADALARNDWDGAAASVERCDDPLSRARVAWTQGDFVGASDALDHALEREPSLPPSLAEVEAHLFAHQTRRAARAGRRMVGHFYPGPSTAEKRYLECIAEQLESLDARGLVDQPGRQYPYRRTCGDRSIPQFAADLESEGGRAGGYAWFSPAYEAVGNPFSAPVGRRGRIRGRPVALERRLLDRYARGAETRHAPYGDLSEIWEESAGDQYARLSALAAELVYFYASVGVPERAQPYWPILDRVATTVSRGAHFHVRRPELGEESFDREHEGDEAYMLQHVMSVAAAAALYAGDEARMKRFAALGEAHSAGTVLQVHRMLDPHKEWETPIEDDHWADHRAIFASALRDGDGRDVADALTAAHATGGETLPRVAGRVTKNREALRAWFDSRFPAPCLDCSASELIGHLADRRTVATLVGDDAEAERLLPATERFAEALTDPAIGWELDELETFFTRGR